MKRMLTLLLSAMLMLGVTGCSSAQSPSKIVKIGVVQLVEHDALDASYRGFVDGLKDAGFEDGKNIKIDFQNAQGDPSNCVTIADKLVNDKSDLILAIATPAAQAVANKTSTIPTLVTAVTDPASAKLVQSNEKPGTNVTGTSDLNPIDKQMELLLELVPDAKKVAMLYCSSEANSEFQVSVAKEQLKAKGVESIDATVTSANEIQQVVQSLAGRADAIYCPTDNMIAEAMVTVSAIASELKIPVIVGEPAVVDNGGLATYGVSYYDLGKLTAQMAVEIIKNGAKPAEMPIQYADGVELVLNQKTADALGLTFPQSLIDSAARIVK